MANPIFAILGAIFPFLAEQARYIFVLEDNIEALKNSIARLESMSVDVRNDVEVGVRQGLEQRDEVRLWLSRVEVIGPKVSLMLEESEAKLERLCFYGFCFNDFGFTYSYSKMVSKELEKVERLLSSNPGEVVARRGLPPYMEVRPTRPTIGFEKMLKSAWERLMKDEVGILGLYGMGGVGKTTLLNQINNKFPETKDEFYVISVVVSQDLQIGRIQNAIGERLGLDNKKWESKTKEEKASAIHKVLKRKRFVMLLDDIWGKVDLLGIGIPIPSQENRSKVVFTTRSKVVCGRMGANFEMEVTCLDGEDAWKLFEQKVRLTTLESHPKIPELARIVCGKCKGLPLALTVIGETMASKTTVHEWEHAIKDLNSYVAEYPEVKEEILKILKFSYDDLKDDRVRQCFQYCALFPEDHKIEKEMLVDYWICEGIINGDREEAVNEGYVIINNLLNVSLLNNINEYGEMVRMHDVVRQMALWIGEQKENFVVKSGAGLNQMPEVRDWNAVRRMSLENNKIRDISVTPDCSNLETLILRQNELVNISGDFFLSMPKLQVLDLSYNKHLSELPEQVSNLVSLRYLGLAGTELKNLPAGLKNLIQLRHLDLTGVETQPSISVLSSLVNLETLYLEYCSPCLSLELIEVIESLKYLKVLSVTINDFVVLERLLSITKLASCIRRISLEGIKARTVSLATVTASLRSLVIEQCLILDIILEDTRHGFTTPRAIRFQNLTFVKLTNVRGMQDLTWLCFAPSLTNLFVFGPSLEMEEIISREKVSRIMKEGSSRRPFEKLRILYLGDLLKLKSIYWEPLDFQCLELFLITQCPELKRLPLNKESAKSNQFSLAVDEKEWLDKLEWEDEATKHRFELLSEVI